MKLAMPHPVQLAVPMALLLGCSMAQSTPTAGIDTSPIAEHIVASPLKEGWQKGVFMEVFVRAYKDSDGDGMGDIKGLTQSLNYLKDLGISGIWLMPITANADGDHGYATTDFRAIDSTYGTMADFDELLHQAHARGIGVIMDYVINHSAAQHPMFESAKSGLQSPFRNWYVWESTSPTGWDIWGKNPWTQTPSGSYFATFGPHMPDFNFKNPDVMSYHMSSLRFWLNRGLDGFRLDAVPHLVENSAQDWNDQPESRRITGELRQLIASYPGRHVVCEATANPQAYAAPDICASAFAFGLERNIVKAVKGDAAAIHSVSDYFKTAPQGMATFISNHDIFAGERLWDQVRGNLSQYKLAAATYLLQPGTPFIYYGEEIGLAGVKGLAGDAPLRSPMSWTADPRGAGFTTGKPFRALSPNVATQNAASQLTNPKSLLAFYKTMIKLRNTRSSLADGTYEAPFVRGQLLGYRRTLGEDRTLVLINYGKRSERIGVRDLALGRRLQPLFPAVVKGQTAAAMRSFKITVPAQSVQVYTLQH